MDNVNQLIQPLRFHTNYSYSVSARHDLLNYNFVSPLIVNKNTLLPFVITRLKSDTTLAEYHEKVPITQVNLIDLLRGTSTNIVSDCSFLMGYTAFGGEGMKEFVLYIGGDALNIRQGRYRLHVHDDYSNTNYPIRDWYSDAFTIRPVNPARMITFKYRCKNNYNFNDCWFPSKADGVDFFYELPLETYTYDTGEIDSFSDILKDRDNLDKYGYERFRVLRATNIRGDSNIYSCLQLMRRIGNLTDGEVYITDEMGYINLIKIEDISTEGIGKSNYLSITVTYSIKNSDVINVNKQLIQLFYVQPTGITPTVVDNDKYLKYAGKNITYKGKKIKY